MIVLVRLLGELDLDAGRLLERREHGLGEFG